MLEQQMYKLTALGLSLGLLALAACGSSETSEEPPSLGTAQSPIDSAGVLISITDAAEASSPIGWTIDSVPELVLGTANDPDHEFFGVRGLRGLPDGGVLVVDAISRELRFFNSAGRVVHRVGRKGEGPGEYDDPYLVHTIGTDSLLVWDGRLKRFQLLSREGEDPKTIRLAKPWPGGSNPPLGAVGSLMFLGTWEMFRAVRNEPLGVKTMRFDFLWIEPETGVETPLGVFGVQSSFVLGHTAAGISVSSHIPFVPKPSGTVSSDAALFTEGIEPEIEEYDLNGRLRRIFRVDLPGRPVTREVIERDIDYQLELSASFGATGSDRAKWDELYSQLPIPETLPAFSSLQSDEVGWLWAEIYPWDHDAPTEWMVFDPLGFARGTITTPAGLRVQRIGENFILGVWRDDWEVEQVHRYGLHR